MEQKPNHYKSEDDLSDNLALSVQNISKMYMLYDRPEDRLKQSLFWRFGKSYGRQFWALRDISFDVYRGETVGIIGRNGSGKSTLLEIIAGTLRATAGIVKKKGMVTALLELGSGFNLDYTGLENIYLSGSILGLSRKNIKQYLDIIINFADIGDFINQPVKLYSSGMYARLAFAIQACIKPDILIVDEALSVGDEKFQRKCFAYIDTLRSNGCSILLVSHSITTIEQFCTRSLLLDEGRQLIFGDVKKSIDSYHTLLYSNKKFDRCSFDISRETRQQSILANLPDMSTSPEFLNKAKIQSWEILADNGQPTQVFWSGDNLVVLLYIQVFMDIDELQTGLQLRTKEGITVFGTSSLYFNENYHGARRGDFLQVEFRIKLALCWGTYFLTFAIAERTDSSDITYIDKKIDITYLNIAHHKLLSTGIAALDSRVTIKKYR